MTGVDDFALLAPLGVDAARLTDVTRTGVDPFGVIVPDVLGRSIADIAWPIGVEPLGEFDPVDREGRDPGVMFVNCNAPPGA